MNLKCALLLSCDPRHRANCSNLGLLVLRVGIGVCFMLHGWPKISGGTGTWEWLGNTMPLTLGLPPVFWGFIAAFAEFGGGLLLTLGLFTRLAAVLMAITMAVAFNMHRAKGDNFDTFSHALESFFVFAALTQLGAGAWSLDAWLFGDRDA